MGRLRPASVPMEPSGKPAILQDTTFTVREGFGYRACRTGAIWMNKLFFSSLALLGVWLLWALAGGETGCVDTVNVVEGAGGNLTDAGLSPSCSVFLTPTAKYLGAMAVLSFLLSIGFGALGLVVGKQILEVAKSQDEVGARREPGPGGSPAEPDRPDPGR